MMTLREQYLAESKSVKDCVKWLNKRIKEKKENVSYDYYSPDNAIIEEMVNIKIGLEKYAKKLKHMANEV
ncbi:hypothetical protein M5X05_26515 [Paenibacillus alvei]|uniref:hypothetical protein n=2 Tax=Paenibacillus alvei TaxID=44250 RepID=UPI000288F8BE|nr:hypothetical protein [Paenibacillus alvei]EJW13923.1 hypothetical protein PAV_141p00290 [Paenibacillus alvei DSM 29]MCY9707713.1 hypothetical protein [Paenibacillus alvei]